jgi:multiple sugar transport system substrate-binding protein
MTDLETLKTNAIEGSRLPPRRSLYEDQEVLEKVPVARLGKEAIINNSTPRPVSPYYSDMSLKLSEQFNAALKGDNTSVRGTASYGAAPHDVDQRGACSTRGS